MLHLYRKPNYLRLRMKEEDVYKLLGMPRSRSSYMGGYMLVFDLYDPKYIITTIYGVFLDRHGRVTSFQSGGLGNPTIDVNVHY